MLMSFAKRFNVFERFKLCFKCNKKALLVRIRFNSVFVCAKKPGCAFKKNKSLIKELDKLWGKVARCSSCFIIETASSQWQCPIANDVACLLSFKSLCKANNISSHATLRMNDSEKKRFGLAPHLFSRCLLTNQPTLFAVLKRRLRRNLRSKRLVVLVMRFGWPSAKMLDEQS